MPRDGITRTVLSVDILYIGQAKVNLVDEGGGLERVTVPLASHVPPRHAAQFLIYQLRQSIQRGCVASALKLSATRDFR